MQKFTYHVISLPHTQTTSEFMPCAYTQKVVKFCRMMMDLGHEVYLYSSDQNEAPCTKHFSCITTKEQEAFFTADWRKEFFPIEWDSSIPYWQIMNSRAIAAMQENIKKTDFICLISGPCQQPIADFFPQNTAVEYGIGYKQTSTKFRVFESYAWMHHVYGLQGIEDGRCYDAVIPNYFDLNDFVVTPANKKGYLLYVGRLINRKGLAVVNELAKATGKNLLVMGQGGELNDKGQLYTAYEQKDYQITFDCDHEYLGVITDPLEKSRIMSEADALICPTSYIGPFEGVSIEAMLSGTPVICTDWGVFTETVQHGKNGFRCRTLADYIFAVQNLDRLDSPEQIQLYAQNNFSLNAVAQMYQHYFEMLDKLWGVGWPDTQPLSAPFWLEKR